MLLSGEHEGECGGGLLGDDAVSEGFDLVVAADVWRVGDPSEIEAHHPVHEVWAESGLACADRRTGIAARRWLRSSRQCNFRWHDAHSVAKFVG